jgi:hypothetical protein
VVLAALERRHEVVNALCQSRDREDAAERIRKLLSIQDGAPPEVVLYMQLASLTTERRLDLAHNIPDLKGARTRVTRLARA